MSISADFDAALAAEANTGTADLLQYAAAMEISPTRNRETADVTNQFKLGSACTFFKLKS